MSGDVFSVLPQILAVILCCTAVKLLDDFLDRECDYRVGRKNWAYRLGNSTLIYGMLFLILGAALDTALVVPLFLACYSFGMFHDYKQVLPSHLYGYQEAMAVFGIGIFLYGWRRTLGALMFVATVQLIDDCVDYARDAKIGQRNMAQAIGIGEALFLAGILSLLSWYLDASLFYMAFGGTLFFYFAALRKQGE